MRIQFLKERWTDSRLGLTYMSYILSYITASTVTYTDISIIHNTFPNFIEYFIIVFIFAGLIISPIIGYFHRKYQNTTDIQLINSPLFTEIRKIIREELDKC